MNAWNYAKASILLDFRQTTVVLRRFPGASTMRTIQNDA
jgi:hypothetical protein